jgi:hypothetical protein
MSYLPGSASSFQYVSLTRFVWANVTSTPSQAAKDARASQDALIDIFERIEMFFRRLEIYTEVLPTVEMTNIIIQIMAEVLAILGIATKDVKRGLMSKYLLYRYDNVC